MKLATLTESGADEAAVLILANSILPIEPVSGKPPSLRERGWPSVHQILPAVITALHYQTDADALAVVVDSNHSPVHRSDHDNPGGYDPKCRLCFLKEKVRKTLGVLKQVPGKPMIKTVIGIAVPAIEAWYLCGKDLTVSEAAWTAGENSGVYPYTKNQLKEKVYGTDRPNLKLETECAEEEAARLGESIDLLRTYFPNGFGPFEQDLRALQ